MPQKELIKLEIQLSKEVKALTKEMEKLKDFELIQVLKHPGRMMGMALLKGLMVGFGSVIGATVLVALFIYILGQISFVPVVGDFIEKVIQEVQVSQPQSK